MADALDNVKVHPTAIVAQGAVIGSGTVVGPYSVVGEHVVLGERNTIASHVVIDGHTTIGDDNTIFQFASVGAAPQDLKYRGEPSTLTIGSRNIIREYVTLQPGTQDGGMKTVIGDQNLFMVCSHVGHDAIIGSNNVFANSCAIAGHVVIGSNTIVGGMCGIHQFVSLGDYCMLGAGAMVTKDIPPYCRAQGDRAGLAGINQIGLERHGFSAEQISEIKRAYRTFFRGAGTVHERLERVRSEVSTVGPELESFLVFIEQSKRGITFPRKQSDNEAIDL